MRYWALVPCWSWSLVKPVPTLQAQVTTSRQGGYLGSLEPVKLRARGRARTSTLRRDSGPATLPSQKHGAAWARS